MSETPNPKPDIRSRMETLHAWYGQAMGTRFPIGMDTERYWFDWLRAGYNGKQLRRVMNYLRKEISAGRRNPGSLTLRNLLQPDKFQEDLVLAGAVLDPETKLPPTPPSEKI